MRTKQVTIEGQSFTIAPLNVEQVEAIGEIDSNDPKSGREAAYDTVINGLNNALPDVVAEGEHVPPAWTRDRVRKQLDWQTFRKLQTEILDFTGLKAEPKADATGEAPAAPETPATIN